MSKTVILNIQFDYRPLPNSGSAARPRRMHAAFAADGFRVIELSGTRKARMEALPALVAQLPSFDPTTTLLYAESATYPHVIDQNSRMPGASPDLQLAEAAHQAGIPTALFYRDMHWAFLKPTSLKRRLIAAFYRPLYRKELRNYARTYDVLYAPTASLMDSQSDLLGGTSVRALPPGAPAPSALPETKRQGAIHVGGITTEQGLYDLRPVLAACSNAGMPLALVCRTGDWEQAKPHYPASGFVIRHAQGEDKDPLLHAAAIGLLYYPPHAYRDVAFPFKLLEYLAAGLPIVCSSPSAAAVFVTENQVGWAVQNDAELTTLLADLQSNPNKIEVKRKAIPAVLEANGWEQRIAQLKRDLWTQ